MQLITATLLKTKDFSARKQINIFSVHTQHAFNSSKLAMETSEPGVKSFQAQ